MLYPSFVQWGWLFEVPVPFHFVLLHDGLLDVWGMFFVADGGVVDSHPAAGFTGVLAGLDVAVIYSVLSASASGASLSVFLQQ